MKKVMLFAVIAMLIGCERPYDGEKRIVVEGQIVDKLNQPIANKPIEIYIGGSSSSSSFIPVYITTFPGQDFISFGNTDSDGRFKLVFPSPQNDEIIKINLGYNKEIFGKISNFSNFKLNLGTRKLFSPDDLTNLKIIPVQVTPNATITDLNITGIQYNYYEDLNNATVIQNNPFENQYKVVKNQTFAITYKLVQGATTTNQSVTVTIGNVPLNYTLNY